jgi:hypothetical protein
MGSTRPLFARTNSSSSLVIGATASLGLIVWLVLPAVVLANDCFTTDEIKDCLKQAWDPFLFLGLIGGSLFAFGWLMGHAGDIYRKSPMFPNPDYSKDWPATPPIDPADFKKPPHRPSVGGRKQK